LLADSSQIAQLRVKLHSDFHCIYVRPLLPFLNGRGLVRVCDAAF
jgi:hypothetical protein